MDILEKLRTYAPDIAAAVATGGSSIWATTALRIASKELLGEDTGAPADVEAAVERATPEQLVNLAKLNAEFRTAKDINDLQRLKSVNETMRTESKSEYWYQAAWRPFWGFITAIAFAIVVVALAVVLVKLAWKEPATVIANLPMIIGSLTTLFGIPGAILGVAAWHRGKEKRIKAEKAPV